MVYFRDSNHFFEEVYNGNVNEIDIKNYVYIITWDEVSDLLSLRKDLLFFTLSKIDELESKITPEIFGNKLQEYYDRNEEPPHKTYINHIGKKLNERNNNKEFPEESKDWDTEKMFYPHSLFTLKQLDNYIVSLLNKHNDNNIIEKKELHENIFSNNGFKLFEHILKEYVNPNRGRLSDIHFFYWKMYNNKPQLIHQRPERFKQWFFETYNEDLGKIKTLIQVENPNRLRHYSNALDWFKTQ